MSRYVILYDDGAYDVDGGWPTTLAGATIYDSREQAEGMVDNIGDGRVVELPTPAVPLSVTTQGPVLSVVELLRDALMRAESGEIIGVGLALACRGRTDATSYAVGEGNIATLVLSCERLKMRLLREGEE